MRIFFILLVAIATQSAHGADPAELARSVLKCETCELTPLTSGCTNLSYKVETEAGNYVLRQHLGNEAQLLINRESELICHKLASQIGIAPQIVSYNKEAGGHLVAEYIEGTSPSKQEMSDPARLKRYVSLLRHLHKAPVPSNLEGVLPSERITTLLDQAIELEAALPSSDQLADIRRFLSTDCAVVERDSNLCVIHGDTWCQNFLENGDQTILIDWEFAGRGPGLYDIAGLITHHLLDHSMTQPLLQEYLQRPATDRETRDFRTMMRLKHLSDALYMTIQSVIDDQATLDYKHYTNVHFARYQSLSL